MGKYSAQGNLCRIWTFAVLLMKIIQYVSFSGFFVYNCIYGTITNTNTSPRSFLLEELMDIASNLHLKIVWMWGQLFSIKDNTGNIVSYMDRYSAIIKHCYYWTKNLITVIIMDNWLVILVLPIHPKFNSIYAHNLNTYSTKDGWNE